MESSWFCLRRPLNYDGTRLFRTGALEDIWEQFTDETRGKTAVFLQEFKIFEGKSLAINVETGLSKELADFILKHHCPDKKIAVGKTEYKKIIEAGLGIHCLYNDAVLELMWGLKNIVKSLVPDEKCELTKEDCCYVSKGMQSIINRYGFEVEPEMVNEDTVIIAATLYECDYCVNKFADYLHRYGKHLQNVSGISSQDWDLQRLAAALKLICYPEENIETGISDQVLSEEMAKTLVASEARSMALTWLESSIKKAKGACVTHK